MLAFQLEVMRKIIAFALLLVSTMTYSQDKFYQLADVFFAKNVDASGQVDYEGIKQSPSELNELTALIASTDYESLSDAQKKAFLTNSYNVLVIKQVVDLYPIKSPLDNPKFFNGIEHTVAGKQLTLDGLEKGTLMKRFFDARAHWVLVCAAKSCPPLANYAYFPEKLDEQFDERTKHVLNLDWFIRVDKKVSVSQIFSWYKADFTQDNKKLIDYINEYRTEPLPSSKAPKFYEYDWSLNKK